MRLKFYNINYSHIRFKIICFKYANTRSVECVMACVKNWFALDAAEALFVPVLALRSATLGIENLKFKKKCWVKKLINVSFKCFLSWNTKFRKKNLQFKNGSIKNPCIFKGFLYLWELKVLNQNVSLQILFIDGTFTLKINILFLFIRYSFIYKTKFILVLLTIFLFQLINISLGYIKFVCFTFNRCLFRICHEINLWY